MKTAKELELNLLVKEAHIQQLKLKNQELLSDNVDIAGLNLKLLNRIDKATKYIEKKRGRLTGWLEISSIETDELLEILKGDKE